jgi:hypothetical protein
MNGPLMILLKISLVIFMAGNLLDMGLKLANSIPSTLCGHCGMFVL